MVHNFYQLGVRAVRLRTKNPAKVEVLEKDAVRVTERVVIVVGQTASNR
jgi:GTP cyclohydrolase II